MPRTELIQNIFFVRCRRISLRCRALLGRFTSRFDPVRTAAGDLGHGGIHPGARWSAL